MRVRSAVMQKVHLGLLIAWVAVGLPLSWLLKDSVPWVVFMSVYTIIATHWTGWSAERPTEIEDE
jgi:hypothetical protein